MDTAITIKTIITIVSCIALTPRANCWQSENDVRADPAHGLLADSRRINESAKADDADLECEQRILRGFEKLTYATLPVSKMQHEVDFSARLECLREICKFRSVKVETNLITTVLTSIMQLEPISTQSREMDLKNARDILLRLCHTQKEIDDFEAFVPDGKHMRGALLVHPAYTHLFSEITAEYDARQRYNDGLQEYKNKAMSFADIVQWPILQGQSLSHPNSNSSSVSVKTKH